MSKTQTKKNFLMRFFSLYRNIEVAAYRLTLAAEQSYAARDHETVEIAGELLIESGLPAYDYLGHYYAGLALLMKGELESADSSFNVASSSPSSDIRERVSLSQSLVSLYKGDCESRMRLCVALRHSNSPFTAIEARRAVAVLRGLQGDHQKAMSELEEIFPLLVNHKNSHLYLEHLNSYAVESIALRKLEQAERAMRAVKRSALYSRRADWQDTDRTLEAKKQASHPFYISQPIDKDLINAITRIETIIYSNLYSASQINAGASVIEGKG